MAGMQDGFTEEWLLDAIRTVSFCIVEDGPVYAPILERLERELDTIRARQDAVARARMHLQRHRERQAAPFTAATA